MNPTQYNIYLRFSVSGLSLGLGFTFFRSPCLTCTGRTVLGILFYCYCTLYAHNRLG
ncbi:hypothetical protein B0H19DRAFT_562288 [Mycena capillaripes]|nr:hypothetical protein B0H19DRAFT_562288 [Mycena capillaripes]